MRLACTAVTAIVIVAAPAPSYAPPKSPRPSVDSVPDGLTPQEWRQIRRSVAASEYSVTTLTKTGQDPILRAFNRRQRYRTTFRRDGIEIDPQPSGGPPWRLGLSVTGYGYQGNVLPVVSAEPRAEKETVEFRRGSLVERYVNRPEGLEQVFELREPPPGGPAPLVLTMAVAGDLGVVTHDGDAHFTRGGGKPLLRCVGLRSWDARGRAISTHLETTEREIRVVVDVSAARFPVTVDPTFVHEAELDGHSDAGLAGQPHAAFGTAVSISADTLVVGASQEDTPGGYGAGAVDVFVRSGAQWIHQQKLLASDPGNSDLFGYSVSVAGDTILVGAPQPNTGKAGKAYVFVRSGTVWAEQQKLVAPDGAIDDRFGHAVSVSGETAAVSAPWNDVAEPQAGSVYVFVRSGATWTLQQKVTAPDGDLNDLLGYSVSLSGETLVAGAWLDDPSGDASGSAYVFVRSGGAWAQQQKLVPADGASNDQFGFSVSISTDDIVVGAWQDDPWGVLAGSAYVFVRSGTAWAQQQKLVTADGAPFDRFGSSVSISGDTVVVGAPWADPGGALEAGAAYVFVRSGSAWSQQQKLTASDLATLDKFGTAVSIAGDRIVSGSTFADTFGNTDTGAAYSFTGAGTTWSESQKLVASDSASHDEFATSVALSNDTAVVGAPADNIPGAGEAGSASVFVRSGMTWIEQQKVFAPDTAPGDAFGWSVAVSGDTMVVGAKATDTAAGADAGAAYVFVRSATTWTLQQKLQAPDAAAGDAFGWSVAIAGDTIAIGARTDDNEAGVDAGSVYVFVRSGTVWAEQQRLVGSDGNAYDYFGDSVAISGDTVVGGAIYADPAPGALDAGAVYVFVRTGTTWNEQQKLFAPDAATYDGFGSSVSVSGDTAAVGAPIDATAAGSAAGSAYVYVRAGATWTLQQKVTPIAPHFEDYFGWSVSAVGDSLIVGAPYRDVAGTIDAGAAYAFTRSGTVWTEQQTLVFPDAVGLARFGYSVSCSGYRTVVGAPGDDTVAGVESGSAHVFRLPNADLTVTKTDGQTTAVPGSPLTYVVAVANMGPDPVIAAGVSDLLPAALLGAAWTCSASAGASCTPSGSGNINDSVSLPAGGTVTYSVTGTVAPDATGTLANTATVAPPSGLPDPDPANNAATDVDTLTPQTDLSVTKTDSADPVSPNDPLTYTLNFANDGPSHSTGVTVIDTLPAGVTLVSSVPGPPTCTSVGGTVTCAMGAMTAGSGGAITINVTVDAGATGMLVNTATVSGNETDPDPRDNTATAATAVGGRDGELSHGTNEVFDLAALPGPLQDEDVFRIEQKPYSSYEVVVDATSGDIGAGDALFLTRLAPDGTTVLQSSLPIGTGTSRSLRWMNTTAIENEGETIRVRSMECTTDCGIDDTYRIRAYETTYSVARFNNSGTQITVFVLQNPTNDLISGYAYFRSGPGTLLATEQFDLPAKSTLVINTASVPGVETASGAITVVHDGRYGELVGKTVALEPATGFSFDTPLVARPR